MAELFTEKEWCEWLDKQRINGYGYDDPILEGCIGDDVIFLEEKNPFSSIPFLSKKLGDLWIEKKRTTNYLTLIHRKLDKILEEIEELKRN